jgi:hypothetical protein
MPKPNYLLEHFRDPWYRDRVSPLILWLGVRATR